MRKLWSCWGVARSRWHYWICGWPRNTVWISCRVCFVWPRLQVVIITAYATIETAVEAMRRGAFDYLPKPFTPDQLRVILDRIAQMRRLQSQVNELEQQVGSIMPEVDLETDEPKMREALDVAFRTAASEATILLARRERHRQGSPGSSDPRSQPARRPSVCHAALPQSFGGSSGE